jgi:capsular polysaccharide biosynthesis protein
MGNQQNIQEDEVDLKEYLKIIIKRKKLILGVFLVSIFIAVVVSLCMPKIYEITSTIQLGSVNEPLIKNEDAKAIILNQNSLLSVINQLDLKIDVKKFKKHISIDDIKDTNLLKINIVYPGIDKALKINEAIIKPFIAQGQIIYQERLAIVNERLKELDEEIINTEKDIARTQTLISNLHSANNISQLDASLRIILLQNTLPNYESNLTALRNQKNGWKISLSNAKDFEIFDQPIGTEYPINHKTRNVIIVGVLSLMLGVFLSFFLEFLENNNIVESKI